MKLSMSLPTMAGGLDRGRLREWCEAVEAGPFHAIAVGERIGFDNLEMHTTLTYAAGVTERVRLASTLTILPMYATAWAAKTLATLDVVSDGRLDLVVGVGGRRVAAALGRRRGRRRRRSRRGRRWRRGGDGDETPDGGRGVPRCARSRRLRIWATRRLARMRGASRGR